MPAEIVQIFDVGDYELQLARAAKKLKDGGVIALPTETVYGAAGLLSNIAAKERLKNLRSGDPAAPFTVHLAKREDAKKFIGEVTDLGRRLMQKLWPGPVALTFDVPEKRRKEIAKKLGVAEGDLFRGESITLRCPDHVVAADVLSQVDGPVALIAVGGTSKPADLATKVDLVLDAGPTRYSKPSTILHVHADRYEIVRTGVYDERIIERLLRTTVLFVCSGNTCRSPMAEGLARKILSDRLKLREDQLDGKGISVMSAGSFALPGARATPQAVEAVKTFGADLTKHRSRPLSVELIHQADVIFTMGKSHAHAVLALVPSASEKVKMLDPDRDIDDPIGGDVTLYQELAGHLKELIEKRLDETVLQEQTS